MREDELIERAIATLREPVRIDPALDARVMERVRMLPAPRPDPAWRAAGLWLVRRRSVRLTPLTGLAAAAGIVLATLVGQSWLSAPAAPAAASAASPAVQFVVLAPGAGAVSVVGDFNDWDEAATPMSPMQGDGLWSVTVPLAPGRYRYSFLVDGVTWVADPAAPRSMDDDFGRPNSVVTVGGT
jgi:hypothetical protein